VLRQDHILIGRKESPSHPRSVASSTHSTSTTVVLSRPSLDHSFASASTVSSSSSSSRDSTPHSHLSTTAISRSPTSMRLSTVNDTEAIIEALFNPPVFSSLPPASLSHSNRTRSYQSTTSARSITTTTAEYSIPESLVTTHVYSGSRACGGDIEVAEFGALRRESTDGNGDGAGLEIETNAMRRPSVATSTTSATTSSGGWGGDDDQNQNQNQSQRGRLLGRLKNPFTISATRRAVTPTPGGSSGSSGGLNASSASVGGRKRSSLDIVYPTLAPALEEMKTPTPTGDGGVAPAPQVPRQMYHPSPQMTTRTLFATPVPAR
jgi:hypothetical protein